MHLTMTTAAACARFMAKTLTSQDAFDRQAQPTMYFIGVTTGQSSSRKMFPLWANLLGLDDAQLIGVDLPINAPQEAYRRVVEHIKDDPLSLGALITTHKINTLAASSDLFDELSADAEVGKEISCIYKRNGKLLGHAVDPEATGEAMLRFVPESHWANTDAAIMCLGAGGSAVALVTNLLSAQSAQERPQQVVIVNRSEKKLDNMRQLLGRLPDSDVQFRLIQNSDPAVNDSLMTQLPAGSMVINATGMGKDIPGSPITDQGLFPEQGIAWELNYRGELDFLHQAKRQEEQRSLTIEDGWNLFVIGWAMVIEYVFDVNISNEQFMKLSDAAISIRGL